MLKKLNKLIDALFSMKAMTLGLFAFLSAIGLATFIESSHGIQAAKILIYNATWFEILLLLDRVSSKSIDIVVIGSV